MAIDKQELQGYREFLKLLYWQIGRAITERQSKLGWGAGVINRLSEDLNAAFPGQEGFSPRNLRSMKKFNEVWPDDKIWQTPPAKLPWSHNLVLIEKLPDTDQRLCYAQKAIEHGWSLVVLEHQIASRLIARQGKAHSEGYSMFGNIEEFALIVNQVAACCKKSGYIYTLLKVSSQIRNNFEKSN